MGAVQHALRMAESGSGPGVAALRLLGGFSLSMAGTPVNLPVNGQRLLAYLSIRGRVPRPVVAGTLWPDVSEHNAHGSLRTTMWRLHRGGAKLVETSGENLALTSGVTVDIRVFARNAQRALRSPVLLDSAGEDGCLQEGLQCDLHSDLHCDQHSGLHGGLHDGLLDAAELLPGWYDDWVIFERERLRQLRLHTLEALAQRLSAQGRFAAALDTALEAIRIEPLRESAHRVVIGIHLAEGNICEAVRHYRFVRDLLREELGVEPSGQLAAMLPAGLAAGLAAGSRSGDGMVTRLHMAR
ncbi:MAG TPA: BTAD domain-containing putative transcriptional regulator [Pseudonocardiaceae bacterium]|nr:BTAD domain-containing putative transcriptional regulator [Pseudonocardiaceae bacterium]